MSGYSGGGIAVRQMGEFNKNIPLQKVDDYKGVDFIVSLGILGFFSVLISFFFIGVSLIVFLCLLIGGILSVLISVILSKIMRKEPTEKKEQQETRF